MAQLKQELNKPLAAELVLLGLHFDASRMFDALKEIKQNASWKHVPVLCYRALQTPLSDTFTDSVAVACTSLGAATFLDCGERPAGSEDLRAAIEKFIG